MKNSSVIIMEGLEINMSLIEDKPHGVWREGLQQQKKMRGCRFVKFLSKNTTLTQSKELIYGESFKEIL